MKPINFPEATKNLGKPSSMTDKECGSLPVWNEDETQCISCWELSLKERLKVLFSGKVWLSVMNGKSQPPVNLFAESPFMKS